jgi:transcription initiation factor TFIIIB Brf1 subunit/transcription initiation factor TFIIB
MNQFDEEFLDFFKDVNTYNAIKNRIETTLTKVPTVPVQTCEHKNFLEEEGVRLCKECGVEVPILDFEPEWRYYGASDNRNTRDPSRCHGSAPVARGNIDKVFVDINLEIPQALRKKAAMKYLKIVGNDTIRGKKRKAIVATCLMYIYREDGDNRTSDEMAKLFGLTKQEMSDGITSYLTVFVNDRVSTLKPSDLILRTLFKAGIDTSLHYQKIQAIAKYLENSDKTLKRSSPQSVASAIVYLYMCLHPEYKTRLGLTKQKFAQKAGLSEITITKLVKKSAELLGCTGSIKDL